MREKKNNRQRFLKGIFPGMSLSAILLVSCLIFSSYKVIAINEIIDIKLDPVVAFDDVPVDFIVNGYLRFETNVIISEKNKVYINIEELFKNLGIKCIHENQNSNLTGFIENESKTYIIDFNASEITIGNKTIKAVNGFMIESGALYVESTVITEAFELNIMFNIRSLSVKLEANFELPLVKQMRLERMRQNTSNLQNKKVVVDTIVQRDYHLFKFGMLDWDLSSYQTINEKITNRVGFGLGAELLNGEANISVFYDNHYKFDKRQLQYNWRWIDNDKKYIKQVKLGKIFTPSISFLEAPFVGANFTNSPSTVRKAVGNYTINEHTEPNWTVELYINNVLVDYTAADASGLFVFKVPIVYGYTTLKLKFYGPLGEERMEERIMNTPYTFMPAKTLEYNVSGGVLQDDAESRFGQGVLNYGVNRLITIGGGVEYLSSIPNYPYIPFAKLAFQPFSKMVLNFEYAHNVRMRGLVNYYFGKSAFLEIDYAEYVDGQMATSNNAKEEFKARLSAPFKIKRVSGYAKVNFNEFVYNAFTYNQFNVTFSGYYKNFNANWSALTNWVDSNSPYATTILSLSYRMRNGLVFRPTAEYNLTDKSFIRYRAEIEKRVEKLNFSVAYERNVIAHSDYVYLNLKYDLPFARAGFTSTYSNKKISFSESAQGSLAFGDKTVKAGYNSALGKGSILFFPFLDLNQNDVFDKDEQMILLSHVRVMGGRAIISPKDSIVRVSDLNAFVDYVVEFDDNDLENIAWRFKYKRYQVLVDPNQFKRIDIPVIAVGEISGMAYKETDSYLKGIGRILMKIYKKNSPEVVAEVLSESDGYFYYLGLEPGEYVARIDSTQLNNLDFAVNPQQVAFNIKSSKDGDIIENINFILETEKYATQDSVENIQSPEIEVSENNAAIFSRPENVIDGSGKLRNEQSGNFTDHPGEFFIYEGEKYPTSIKIIPVEQKKIPQPDSKKNEQYELKKNIGPVSVVMDSILIAPGDTLYKVQLLAVSNPIKVDDYFTKLLTNIPGLKISETKKDDGLFRYCTGAFRDVLEARELMGIIREYGLKDSFLAIYAEEKPKELTFRLERNTF